MSIGRRVAVVGIAAALAAGCGGDGGGGDAASGLGDTLSYFAADTSLLVVVSTDLESEHVRELDRLVRRRFGQPLEEFLRDAVESDSELSWEDDVRPLLGHELAIGVADAARAVEGSPDFVVAFRTTDGDQLRDVLAGTDLVEETREVAGARLYRALGGEAALAVEGDHLVAAGDEAALLRALERADGDDHMTEAQLGAALEDLPEDALVRLYGDARRALEISELSRFRTLPWVAALRTVGAALGLADGRFTVDFALNTDAEQLSTEDLPLATGSEAPEVLRRDGEIVGGNRNQSLTTAFLFRAAEVALPDSRFVRDVDALERELGIDFVSEVLRQFDGPSASSVSLDGQTFAARSDVRDPERLAQLLPRLAPHLPRLVAGLEALQSEGQALLFLLAPDVLVLQRDRVTVTRAGDLWRVGGLTGEGPDALFFGVLDSRFVVASTPELARSVAAEETVEVEGARGAGVLRVDLRDQVNEAARRLGLPLGPAGEVVAWLEASEARLRGRLTAELR